MIAARDLRGAIVWAFTAFLPASPFEVVRDADGAVVGFDAVEELARAAMTGEVDREPGLVVHAKIRPVLILQSRPRGEVAEYAALKISRFGKLGGASQERIRSRQEPAAFYLARQKSKYGLEQEAAVDLNSLVRLHESAILTAPVGRLDSHEIDVVGRQLAASLDIDLGPAIREGVVAKMQELARPQRGQAG